MLAYGIPVRITFQLGARALGAYFKGHRTETETHQSAAGVYTTRRPASRPGLGPGLGGVGPFGGPTPRRYIPFLYGHKFYFFLAQERIVAQRRCAAASNAENASDRPPSSRCVYPLKRAQVPFIAHGDFVLDESHAILRLGCARASLSQTL